MLTENKGSITKADTAEVRQSGMNSDRIPAAELRADRERLNWQAIDTARGAK